MGAASDSPQAAFARFVRRAIDDAKDERGWSVTDLAAHTGVGRSTVFRWLAGDWHDYPELAKVRGFCAALDVPVTAAFRALGLPDGEPARDERRQSPTGTGIRTGRAAKRADAQIDADVRVILTRLADPSVPTDEKQLIRDLLRYLAQRPVRKAG
ncbi:helix-turn-helix domain-containing protein [Micromonospora sp. NBC_01699]|uniref:helix-turn-helix domain-containing protein n=1 Tax=Micromonospora sp. NBC_01699 TaxID=2975984 RepID=UPI002E288309|nr:helix-turn-helix transcriptional regulator [Micromonospora sp. NBC_01699]